MAPKRIDHIRYPGRLQLGNTEAKGLKFTKWQHAQISWIHMHTGKVEQELSDVSATPHSHSIPSLEIIPFSNIPSITMSRRHLVRSHAVANLEDAVATAAVPPRARRWTRVAGDTESNGM